MRICATHLLMVAAVGLLLGSVCVSTSALPTGELAYQWWWVARTSVVFALCLLTIIGLNSGVGVDRQVSFSVTIVWVLIVLGGVEAIWGLCQMYGFTPSNHRLFTLTGSFFNPGPYSGYVAMVLPICLSEWLTLKKIKEKSWIEQLGYCLSVSVMLLILCVLPAGMSRSAWLAAIISGIWVYGMHHAWGGKLRQLWITHRKIFWGGVFISLLCLFIGGVLLFHLKRDSASGRLFMWKITSHAILQKPLSGYGSGNFAMAYGAAQETYFATGNYSLQEELVAGSPEYAFNEYLQIATEWGIPALICILLVVGFCLWRGAINQNISACGGVISLLVFAFFSYPMQFPAFIVTFACLLAACVVAHSRIAMGVFALLVACMGVNVGKSCHYEACKEWASCKMLYQTGGYGTAKEGYEQVYPMLKDRGAFLFEYGHCLHKLKEYDASTNLLKEAATRSCDPMILNIIGKNYQLLGEYEQAENYLIRSTHLLPARIYPYYLLAKLYAEPNFYQPEKLKQAVEIVLTKEPKVQSTAVKEMRMEVKTLSSSCEIHEKQKPTD